MKLNSDTGTAIQWQPSLTATQDGALFASWYDGREANGGADLNCTAGSSSQPCYRRWGRVSYDNGATWLPDDMVGRAMSPLPAQPDGAVQPNYQGDYDYHSSFGTTAIGAWTDGRNTISGNSQQDVFVNFVSLGFGVATSNPACGILVTTAPVDFVINLSAAVNTSTVQASDFTVNGIAANSFVLGGGNTQITFHFNSSPVTIQGPQTMHIPAGAFNRASDNQPNVDFQCSFCFAAMPLQVTTTNPSVGGTFSPPAPNDYTYDVNFNQAVDPASVQTSDLTLTGNVGGSVTGVQLINGNTTARFTVHFNSGGSVTASIGAGSITAQGCNANVAFSGSYTVSGCSSQDHYQIAQIGGSIVPGTTDIGNHGDDTVTTIALPFSYTFYDQTFTSINLSSNGNAQFTTTDTLFSNQCLPWLTHNYTIYPYWDDLYLAQSGFGIFTSVSGIAPNRIFNIEWRAQYFPPSSNANFELRLYEGQKRFDIIYGPVGGGNTSATAGVQKNDTTFDQYFCNGSGGASTGGQSYMILPCGTPSPTPTATATPRPTATATATATATLTPVPTATATATATATLTPVPTATATATATATLTPVPTATATATATATLTPVPTATATATATATLTPVPTATATATATATIPPSPTPTATATLLHGNPHRDADLRAAFGPERAKRNQHNF